MKFSFCRFGHVSGQYSGLNFGLFGEVHFQKTEVCFWMNLGWSEFNIQSFVIFGFVLTLICISLKTAVNKVTDERISQ